MYSLLCWRRKGRQRSFLHEEIEKRQRQAGIKEFLARRGVSWTPTVKAENNRKR